MVLISAGTTISLTEVAQCLASQDCGSPVLPGAMFLYALLDSVTILGLPACVFYHPTTIYDLILPRILAGEKITKNEIAEMGHGGLCLDCEICRFPHCSFGK